MQEIFRGKGHASAVLDAKFVTCVIPANAEKLKEWLHPQE